MNEQMSVVLGTVAMEPKGEYSAEAYYEKLNTVLYNDSTYMAIKPSHNILPIDTEYWQLIGGGVQKENTIITYNTVANMKADTKLKVGMTVQTLGYYAVNDGGGATYKIIDTESETDYQEELQNGLFATLLVENNDINVKQFGAIGNGIADDTIAIQNALSYLDNKPLYFNEGTYLISNELLLRNGHLIGKNAIIKTLDEKLDNTDNKMLNPTGSLKIKGIKFDANNIDYTIIPDTQLTSIDIDNCEFTGCKQQTNESDFSLNSAVFLYSKYIEVNNCNIHDNLSHGLRLKNSLNEDSYCYVKNSKFINNGVGIVSCGLCSYGESDGENFKEVIIENCTATGNGATGIAPHSIYNCIINNCYSGGNGEHGYCYQDGKNGVINNSIAYNNTSYGIRIQGDYSSQSPHYDNFIITNNNLLGNNGISISENIDGGIIKNNIIKSTNGNMGIKLGDGGRDTSYVKNIIIKDNFIDNFNNYINVEIMPSATIECENTVNGKKTKGFLYKQNKLFTELAESYFKYGNSNNLNTTPTDFSEWTTTATRDGNTFTPTSTGVCSKRISGFNNPKFISYILNFANYSNSLNILIRFRNSNATLLSFTTPSGDTYDSIGHSCFPQGNTVQRIIDVSQLIFTDTISIIEVVINGVKDVPITLNSFYLASSNELPILPNEI